MRLLLHLGRTRAEEGRVAEESAPRLDAQQMHCGWRAVLLTELAGPEQGAGALLFG